MPAHIVRRRGKKITWYLIDGRFRKSLKTSVKRYAEQLLDKYNKGKLRLTDGMTVGEFYETWIREKESSQTLRKSLLVSYKQHYSGYLRSEFGLTLLATISVSCLSRFRSKLLDQKLSVKTCRNIIDATFRTMWKDARRAGLVESNPFELLDWPAYHHDQPDPFTVEERDAILAWTYEHERFYFPWVYFQFATGCRPSESCALRWGDLDAKNLTVSITKSRNLGQEKAPKTRKSYRKIKVDSQLLQVVQDLEMPGHDGHDDYVFYNKANGGPLNSGQWARDYWKRICDGAKVKQRKFYATRHTSITEAIKLGAANGNLNLLAIAQYHGTSVNMIENNYCGALEIAAPQMPVIEIGAKKRA